jgi:NitT/TauT family transport system permease protein
MAAGTVLGLLMGRYRGVDRLGDPWLVVLLNLPALVIIVLAYIWAGLTESAAIAAVALNKLPIATVTVREGARSLDAGLDDMAQVFRMGPWVRLRHVVFPQLAPYLAAAAAPGYRWYGRSSSSSNCSAVPTGSDSKSGSRSSCSTSRASWPMPSPSSASCW